MGIVKVGSRYRVGGKSYKSKDAAVKAYQKNMQPIDGPYIQEKPPARLEIEAEDLPAIKKWEVGKTYKLTMDVKMVSKSEGGWNGDQPLSAVFHVTKATSPGGGEDDDD